MITIEIKLFVTLSKYLPENKDAHPMDEGSTIQDLIDELKLPVEQVKLIFVNGKKQDTGYGLVQGDRVGIFPPVGGG